MAKLVADSPIELEFQKLCEENSAELNKLWAYVKNLSDATGVPVGPYVPDSFKDKFGGGIIDLRLVEQLTGVNLHENDYWYSSSAEC